MLENTHSRTKFSGFRYARFETGHIFLVKENNKIKLIQEWSWCKTPELNPCYKPNNY